MFTRSGVLLMALLLCRGAWALDEGLVKQARGGVRQAVQYLRSEVAAGGGYLGSYLADLSDQWGETRATRTQNWIQPPGSPSTGFAFLRLWEATGDKYYLEAASEVAEALVRGQLQCGGWDYIVDHDPAAASRWYYRQNEKAADPALKAGRNQGTLDDNTTQHATRLLMAVDQALEFKHAAIHEAAMVALDYLLRAQQDSGGWPQRFPLSGRGYGDFFTFNDYTIQDCADVMMIAYRTYGEKRYQEAVQRCGDFILKTQLPAPQAIWAQQYDLDLQPAWARRFEPPSACSNESLGVLRLLAEIALFTGDDKYLTPFPAALDWYRRSALPDGKYARFYELKTNRPLYFTSDQRTTYWLTYSDHDLPDHYGFKGLSYPRSLEQTYEAMKQQGLAAYAAARTPRPQTREQKIAAAEALEEQVKTVLGNQDAKGRWLRKDKIEMTDFQKNLQLLANYLRLASG